MSQNKQLQDKDYFDFLIDEANHPFAGWDFSHITTTRRMVEGALSWSYAGDILMRLKYIQALLDMGTGGENFYPVLSKSHSMAHCRFFRREILRQTGGDAQRYLGSELPRCA